MMPSMRGRFSVLMVLLLATAGCGGATPPPEEPDHEMPPVAKEDPEPPAPEPEPEPEEPKPAAPEPEFTEGMSVNEAINAVPQGTTRVNMDQDELSAPLTKFELYEPCKPKPNQHFKVKVAVWMGKAVGVDVTTDPKNDKLAECLKEQIRTVEWKDPVPSLNTVEYGF
jgi:hypothetical protein